MKSEYGLPPLEVSRQQSNALEIESEENGQNNAQSDESKKMKERELLDIHEIQPKLCPLIQSGLDRQWISEQISEKELRLDTIASLSCSKSKLSTADKMARLKGKME